MKLRLLILSALLLIASTLMSQNGLTLYPFSENQVRTMGRVRLEYTFLLEENKNMRQMLDYCDSIVKADSLVIVQQNIQIRIWSTIVENRDDRYNLMKEQLNNCTDQIKKERRKRFLYMGTTAGALTLLVLVLLTGG